MYQYSNSLIRQFSSPVTGNAAVGVQATVYVGETNTLASLFEVNGSARSNPVTTDDKGFYYFSLTDGDYRIVFSSSQFATLRISVLDGALLRQDFNELVASNTAFRNEQQAAYDSFVLSQGWDQVGTFAAGFTYTSPNQVGQDIDGNWWRWNGSLPKVVTAGTLPSSDANYKLVGDGVLRSDLAAGTADIGGQTAQDVADKAVNSKQNIPEPAPTQSSAFKPVKWLTTEQIKSLADDFQPSFNCGLSTSLQFFEVLVPVVAGSALIVVWDIDSTFSPVDGGASDVSVNVGSCTSLTRAGFVSKTSTTAISGGDMITTVASAQLDQSHFAVSIRLNPSSSERLTVRGLKVYQAGKLLASPNLKLIAPSDRWGSTARDVSFVDGKADHAIRMQLSGKNSFFSSPEVIDVSPNGGTTFSNPPYSWQFMKTNAYTSALFYPRTIRMLAGGYSLYREDRALNQASDLNIIAVGGKAKIMCGVELPTSSWASVQVSPRQVYSAPYDWDTNFDADIRAGTKQPFLTRSVPLSKRGSALKYIMTNVASQAAVLANDYSYWYDYANKLVYFSFDAANDNCNLFIAEADTGINMGTTPYNLNAYNVDIYATKGDNWRLRPSAYTRFTSGGKYAALSSCGGYASLTENGIRVDNLDHQLIDCVGMSNGNDGLNLHFGGNSYIAGDATKAWNNADDGISHHEQQYGFVSDVSIRYNGAGISTPAFGAIVYHKNCEGVAPEFGLNPSKPYAGTFATLSGQSANTTAWYDACFTDDSGLVTSAYYVDAQEIGTTATSFIIRARQSDSAVDLTDSGGAGTAIISIS